jgi:hypothetical protein
VLAAAAALVLLLLAGGLLIATRRSSSAPETLVREGAPEAKENAPGFSGPRPPLGSGNPVDDKLADARDKPEGAEPESAVAVRRPVRRFSRPRPAQQIARLRSLKAARPREELARQGEEAKAQLIMALHIASDKLSAVQKKIQNSPGT